MTTIFVGAGDQIEAKRWFPYGSFVTGRAFFETKQPQFVGLAPAGNSTGVTTLVLVLVRFSPSVTLGGDRQLARRRAQVPRGEGVGGRWDVGDNCRDGPMGGIYE